MKENKESYLVFGSRGFLGSRLVKTLELIGKQVIRGDRDGSVPLGADYIIDCQSYGNMFGQTDETEIYKANYENLWKIIKESKGARLLYVSSSSVLLPTQTTYSKAKAKAELLCAIHGGVSIRPSSIIGPGEQKEHLIPKLIESCFHGTEIPFVGEPTHDFISVFDVVSAIRLLLVTPDAPGRVFNVSSGTSTTNEEVLRLVEGLTGFSAVLARVSSMRPYDTREWKVDNSEMLKLGWQPKVPLEQSIKDMISERSWENVKP